MQLPVHPLHIREKPVGTSRAVTGSNPQMKGNPHMADRIDIGLPATLKG